MGILRFNYRSEAIGRYIDLSIVYPTDALVCPGLPDAAPHAPGAGSPPSKPAYRPGMKFQTVYLIHGGGDDDSLVYRYTNAERYAQRNQVMLVTPDITNSFGVDTCYGVGYATFLTTELPVVMQSLFASSPRREDNFIVGYAMGGNVALGCALTRPDLYRACVDISGGIGLTVNTRTLKDELDGEHFRTRFPLYNATFGPSSEIDGSRFDLMAAARRNLETGSELPAFTLIAGSEEGAIGKRVRADADTLQTLGYDVTFLLAEGHAHDFRLWDRYLEITLDELLPLRRTPLYPEG
ncbi:MAG: hypothetical protein KBA30_00405 [Clostridia bacterium]|nr:hypothetical protein [Clostridia bacterium]